MIEVHWICTSCGFYSANGREAFLHRSGDSHFVQPIRVVAEGRIDMPAAPESKRLIAINEGKNHVSTRGEVQHFTPWN